VIVLKSAREIALMRRAGHILAGVVERLRASVRSGMSTLDIDEDVEAYIHREGAAPAFKGYRGFPATVCVSINEEVVHGIPSPRRKIHEGDIVGERTGKYTGTKSQVRRFEIGVPTVRTTGAIEAMPHWAGESVGGVRRVQSAAEIVHELSSEAEDLLKRWG